MKLPIKKRSKEERKEFKEYAKGEAIKGMTYGNELVENWSKKFKFVWIVRAGLIFLILFLLYKIIW